jgi:integrase
MRIYKPTYTDKNKKSAQVKKWWIELSFRGIARRFPACTDKQASEFFGRQIERLMNFRDAGEQPNAQLTSWLEQIPAKLRDRFAKIGLIDLSRAAAGKPLIEHFQDFRQSLVDDGDTSAQAELTYSRIKRIFVDECGFKSWSEISASRVQQKIAGLRKLVERVEFKKSDKDFTDSQLAELRKQKDVLEVIRLSGRKLKLRKSKDIGEVSKQTKKFYLQAAKHFCRWMVLDRRASSSPLEHLGGIKVDESDLKHRRRALTTDEVRRLLEATKESAVSFGLSGYERVLIYRLAAESGLRANEIRTLTVSSFDLKNLMVAVSAGNSKNRKQAVLPLRPETAAELSIYFAGKLPTVQAFNVPDKTYEMIKADLEAAGIDYIDESGRFADFHSLRHTFGSSLAAAGVHPKTAQELMRHSDINLTMLTYTHTLTGQLSKAINSLPDLSLPSSKKQQQAATGTDNADVISPQGKNLAEILSDFGALPVNSMQSGAVCKTNTRNSGAKNAGFNAPGVIRTHDLRFRKPSLYPTELRALNSFGKNAFQQTACHFTSKGQYCKRIKGLNAYVNCTVMKIGLTMNRG